jgi:hypothetical protein
MKNKIFIAVAVLVCAGGVWYYINRQSPQNPPTSPSPATQSQTSNTPKTVRGYIVATTNSEITVDDVQTLSGEAAYKAMVADGYCKESDPRDACEEAPGGYDRDVDLTLKTYKLASGVQITDDTGRPLTLAKLGETLLARFYPKNDATKAYYSGILFDITLNDKGEVVRIDGVFRP